MTHHDTETMPQDTAARHHEATDVEDVDESTAAYVDFLTDEFPEWQFAVDATATWSGDARELWIATREGHHPQSELTAGKLHRRLSDYEERERSRRPQDN